MKYDNSLVKNNSRWTFKITWKTLSSFDCRSIVFVNKSQGNHFTNEFPPILNHIISFMSVNIYSLYTLLLVQDMKTKLMQSLSRGFNTNSSRKTWFQRLIGQKLFIDPVAKRSCCHVWSTFY